MKADILSYYTNPVIKTDELLTRFKSNLGESIVNSFLKEYFNPTISELINGFSEPITNRSVRLSELNKKILNEQSNIDELTFIGKNLKLLNPKLLIKDIAKAQNDTIKKIAHNYALLSQKRNVQSIQNQLVQRVKLEENVVEKLIELALSPLSEVNNELTSFAKSIEEHHNNIKKISDDTFGSGLMKAASISGGLITSLAIGAVTGNPLLSRNARKATSKGVAKFVFKKRHWETLKKSNQLCVDAYKKLAKSFQVKINHVKDNLCLLIVNLHLGFIDKLNIDFKELGWRIDSVNWKKWSYKIKLTDQLGNDLKQWANNQYILYTKAIEEVNFPKAAEIAERALIYVLSDNHKTNYIYNPSVSNSPKKESLGVVFAKLRFHAISIVADELWNNKEYMKAATLYINIFHNFKILWEDSLEEFKLDTALYRIAIAGTSQNAPQYIKENTYMGLELALFHEYKQNQKGRLILHGERISTNLNQLASILSAYSTASNSLGKIRTKIAPEIQLSLRGSKFMDDPKTNNFHLFLLNKRSNFKSRSKIKKWARRALISQFAIKFLLPLLLIILLLWYLT